MLLVHIEKSTSRLKFAFNLIFRELLQLKFELTEDLEEFKNHEGAKFHYGPTALDGFMNILSHSLLFEIGISEQEINIEHSGELSYFFASGPKSDYPFDLFAASFYLASRYEEYLPHKRDNHDRFEAEQSILVQEQLLKTPLVNRWSLSFWHSLSSFFPELQREKSEFKSIISIDVDATFLYREKGFVRSAAGIVADVLRGKLKQAWERSMVIAGKKQDPFDSYEYQLTQLKKHKAEFIYFLLIGGYGLNDKNIPISNPKFQALIKHLSDYAKVGIHPSYASYKSFKLLEKEVGHLSPILNREIVESRQHFLRLKFPETYRNLIDLDIMNDYTMGYATHYGFRAGLCSPYYFYDLDLEVETQLKIHPFVIMESTLIHHMGLQPEDAFEHYKNLIDEVKAVDGTFMSVWHNDTLGNLKEYKGWKSVFERVIQYGKDQESK